MRPFTFVRGIRECNDNACGSCPTARVLKTSSVASSKVMLRYLIWLCFSLTGVEPPLFQLCDGLTLRARPCAMSYARITGIHSQFVSIIKAIRRSGACPAKYPTVTAVAVIVFSIQLYFASECFLAGCLLTSQNMQPNMNTKPAHSRRMNG